MEQVILEKSIYALAIGEAIDTVFSRIATIRISAVGLLSCGHGLGDRRAAATGVGPSSEIARSEISVRENRLDSGEDLGGGLGMTEGTEHHRARPDLADRIGDSLPRNIGRRTMNRFKKRRKFAFWVNVGRWRDADRAGAGWAEIREDVAKQVRRDDNVEAVRIEDELRGQNVDVVLVAPH